MGLLKRREKRPAEAGTVQLRDARRHPFAALDRYVPLQGADTVTYRSIREAIPVIDAAIAKMVRLCGGVSVRSRDESAQPGLEQFLRTVPTGRGQRGIQSFLDCYLDSMLTCGRAVGEIVPARSGRDVAAVLCGDVDGVCVQEGNSPLDFLLCGREADGSVRPLPRQELLLFTPFQPESGSPYGVSMLRSMPYLAGILMQIYETMGLNWEQVGNVRFAISCKGEDGSAEERCARVAREWSEAMSAGPGAVRDFVTSGDVDIKVIGADNQVLDSEVPVRQLLEQLISRTGIPPFLLGLTWSSTERMSSQQADILTSEIDAIRRSLTPVVERICSLWLRLHGHDGRVDVVWDTVNLQDEETLARAELYRAQSAALNVNGEGSERHGCE